MFLDFLFPRLCVGCGYVGTYLCLNCHKKLSVKTFETCFYCRKHSWGGFTHPFCQQKHGVDGWISFYRYTPIMKALIKSIKYRLVTDTLCEFFTMIPPRVLQKLSPIGVIASSWSIQPIPLHSAKYSQRGFNQSERIARFLLHLLPNTYLGDNLVRHRPTLSQAQLLSRTQKYHNVRGAFSIIQNPMPENILLIDDVVTTGNTTKEACKILKKSGVRRVIVVSLAGG